MAVQRISNVSLFNSTIRNVSTTQQSLYDLQIQISSGIKANNFQGLNGQVEQFIGFEGQLRKLDQLQQNNAVLESRLRNGNQSLDTIIDVADQIEDLLVLRRSATTSDNLNLTMQLRDKLKTVADAMNINSEGRYLFSGTSTNVKPLPTVPVTNVQAGVPDTGYYAGSRESVVHRVEGNIEIEFPVRGDDEAFQKLFAAVDLALNSPDNDQAISKAIELMQSAQTGLNTLQAKVNSTIINLDQLTARQDQQKLYLKGLTEEVSKTDVVAATTKVANDQAILQASYQVFARLIQLKLSDFL